MRLYAPVLIKISCSSWAVNTSSAATRGDGGGVLGAINAASVFLDPGGAG